MKYGQKEIFSANGHIEIVDGRHRFIPKSKAYLNDNLRRIKPGKELQCTFSEHVPTRSPSQLAYHWVLVGYIAEHCGYTKEECHDGIMRLHFGEKEIIIDGKAVKVRKSIADRANLTKNEAVGLVQYDLGICAKLEINVPSASELGYTSNDVAFPEIKIEYPTESNKTAFD